MHTRRTVHRALAILGLLGLLAACSLPGRDPEIVVVQLPTSTGLPTPPPQDPGAASVAGSWIMPAASLNLFVASLFPSASSFMRITAGQLSMTLNSDGTYIYAGEYTLQVDAGDGDYSEGVSTFTTTGTYSTTASTIRFETGATDARMISCTAYKDGAVYTVPCDSFVMVDLLLPSEAPFRRSADTLEIDVPAPSGGILTMFFER